MRSVPYCEGPLHIFAAEAERQISGTFFPRKKNMRGMFNRRHVRLCGKPQTRREPETAAHVLYIQLQLHLLGKKTPPFTDIYIYIHILPWLLMMEITTGSD